MLRRSAELAQTALEAMQHMNKQAEEGLFEESLTLFQDVLDATVQIEKSIAICAEHIDNVELKEHFEKLGNSFGTLASAYENGEFDQIQPIVSNTLIPQYVIWKEELERCVNPYILS